MTQRIDSLVHRMVGCLLLLAGEFLPLAAQGEFDPSNPAEPNQRYRVTVKADPAESAYTSGNGRYQIGEQVWVSSSACYYEHHQYEFRYWTKNAETEPYSTESGFYYTAGNEPVTFVAHYEDTYTFNPSNPDDPAYTATKYRLFLNTNQPDACSFNIASGSRFLPEEWVYLQAYPNTYFRFDGWMVNGTKVSTQNGFYYQMPNGNVTVTAAFTELEFDPTNPGDPSGTGQGNVDNQTAKKGDVNKDGSVNTTDAVLVINYYLGKTKTIDTQIADMNSDGAVNTTDAVVIINKYLNK